MRIKTKNNFGGDIKNIKGAASVVTTIQNILDNINKGKVEFNEISCIAGNIGVNDSINPNWVFEVSGNTRYHSYLLCKGFVNIENKLDVYDDVSLGSHLEVHGDASFNKSVEISNNELIHKNEPE